MKRRVEKLIRRAQRTTPIRVLVAYGESRASNYALGLAFAGFMSMFPIMLGALSIIGLALRNPGAEADFQRLVLQVFPGSAQPELQKALLGVKQSAGWLGVVSLVGLIWSASNIYATLEFALTRIFGTRHRNMLRQRLMGLVMMVFFPLYVRAAGEFNTYGAQFALFFLLATWFYFLSQLVLLGAVYIRFRRTAGAPDVADAAGKGARTKLELSDR